MTVVGSDPTELVLLAVSHRLHDQADNRREDCTADPAADRLANNRAQIDAATCCTGERWYNRLQQLSATEPTECTCDGVSSCPKVGVFHLRSSGVTPDDAGN